MRYFADFYYVIVVLSTFDRSKKSAEWKGMKEGILGSKHADWVC